MTAPKERPILFSGPMVRALLNGRKTQTRRIVKPQPYLIDDIWWIEDAHSGSCRLDDVVEGRAGCRRYQPGDRLWVKETWGDVNLEGGPGIAYRANGDLRDLMEDETFLDEREAFNYDDPRLNFGAKGLRFCVWSSDLIGGLEGSWRPSIHMPRWASRLTLEITEVRVERLQDISEADAKSEGCDPIHMQPGGPNGDPGAGWISYRAGFESLWEQINGPDSWDANPWVWAVSFRVLERA